MAKKISGGIPHLPLIGGLIGGLMIPALKTSVIDPNLPGEWGISTDIALLGVGLLMFFLGGKIHRIVRYMGMGIIIIQGADLLAQYVPTV